ncbi:hypothetical protein BJH93_08900 [Kocuria polaris]|nr:hypothetical protein [Kocuria polaris]
MTVDRAAAPEPDLAAYSIREIPQCRGGDSENAVDFVLSTSRFDAPRFGDIDCDDDRKCRSVGDRARNRYLHDYLCFGVLTARSHCRLLQGRVLP